MRRDVWFFCTLTLVAPLLGAAATHENSRPTGAPKTLRIGITVSNPSAQQIDNGEVKVFGPLAGPTSNFQVQTRANEAFQEEIDALGNRTILFSRMSIPPYATRRYVVTFELTPRAAINGFANFDRRFLAPEPLIESDATEIVRQARSLLSGGDPNQYPQRAYEWVAQHIHYEGFVADDRGALYGFRAATGDCTEYATLFVALMRAAEIPARVVGGWVLKTSSVVKANEYHNWAEYFAEGRWHLVDPQRRVFNKENEDYVATRIVTRTAEAGFSYRYELTPSALQVRWD